MITGDNRLQFILKASARWTFASHLTGTASMRVLTAIPSLAPAQRVAKCAGDLDENFYRSLPSVTAVSL